VIASKVSANSAFSENQRLNGVSVSCSDSSHSSGDNERHRLNRYGDRQPNAALRTIAMTQIGTGSTGGEYYDRKIAESKTPRSARRCLKRHLIQ